jgi:hypothetical protein
MATGDFNAKDGKLHGRVSRGANLLAKLRGKKKQVEDDDAQELAAESKGGTANDFNTTDTKQDINEDASDTVKGKKKKGY